MNPNYQEHLKSRFEAIHSLQKVVVEEKDRGIFLVKDYFESLKSFPQWLTIFSGFLTFLVSINRCLLILAFICFLASALVILFIGRTSAKIYSCYVTGLNEITTRTAEFTHKITQHSRGEITDAAMKRHESEFDNEYEHLRERVRDGKQNNGKINSLMDWAFGLSVVGGILLALTLITIK